MSFMRAQICTSHVCVCMNKILRRNQEILYVEVLSYWVKFNQQTQNMYEIIICLTKRPLSSPTVILTYWLNLSNWQSQSADHHHHQHSHSHEVLLIKISMAKSLTRTIRESRHTYEWMNLQWHYSSGVGSDSDGDGDSRSGRKQQRESDREGQNLRFICVCVCVSNMRYVEIINKLLRLYPTQLWADGKYPIRFRITVALQHWMQFSVVLYEGDSRWYLQCSVTTSMPANTIWR